MNLVLASTSVYRKELLARLGLPFEVAAPAVDETPLPDETPEQLVRRLSEAKARAVAGEHPDALIIGSDQVAVVEGEIIGKPMNHERATEQLRKAAGKELLFLTGVCVYNTPTASCQVDTVPVTVTFRALNDRQIENYLQRERPYHCAGAFKSEGLGIALCQNLSGKDPTALMGLPLIRLTAMLESEGLAII